MTNRIPRHPLSIAAALLALAFSAFSATLLLASLADFRAETLAESWDFQSQQAQFTNQPAFTPIPDELARGEALAKTATRLAPYVSHFHGTLADILVWRGKQSDPVDSGAMAAALDEYRASIRLDPYQPRRWLGLIYGKHESGQIDAEYHQALATALRLGAWNQIALMTVEHYGLEDWEHLPEDTRRVVIEAVTHRLSWTLDSDQTQRDEVSAALLPITSAGLRKEFCARLPRKNPHAHIYCWSIWKKELKAQPGPN